MILYAHEPWPVEFFKATLPLLDRSRSIIYDIGPIAQCDNNWIIENMHPNFASRKDRRRNKEIYLKAHAREVVPELRILEQYCGGSNRRPRIVPAELEELRAHIKDKEVQFSLEPFNEEIIALQIENILREWELNGSLKYPQFWLNAAKEFLRVHGRFIFVRDKIVKESLAKYPQGVTLLRGFYHRENFSESEFEIVDMSWPIHFKATEDDLAVLKSVVELITNGKLIKERPESIRQLQEKAYDEIDRLSEEDLKLEPILIRNIILEKVLSRKRYLL